MTRESAVWDIPWLKRLALVTMWPCRFHLLESSGRGLGLNLGLKLLDGKQLMSLNNSYYSIWLHVLIIFLFDFLRLCFIYPKLASNSSIYNAGLL